MERFLCYQKEEGIRARAALHRHGHVDAVRGWLYTASAGPATTDHPRHGHSAGQSASGDQLEGFNDGHQRATVASTSPRRTIVLERSPSVASASTSTTLHTGRRVVTDPAAGIASRPSSGTRGQDTDDLTDLAAASTSSIVGAAAPASTNYTVGAASAASTSNIVSAAPAAGTSNTIGAVAAASAGNTVGAGKPSWKHKLFAGLLDCDWEVPRGCPARMLAPSSAR